MILSNIAIQQAIDENRLVIEPEPLPREPTASTPDCPYDTSAVDIRLGSEIAFFREGLAVSIDLSQGKFGSLFGSNSQSVTITEDQPFQLHPGRFVLGKTLETVRLPIRETGPNLAARVEGKSSYARCGLLVHFTAPTIHAGFEGTITLELVDLGPLPITLRPGTPICQLIFEEVQGTPFRKDSQFHGQSRAGGRI